MRASLIAVVLPCAISLAACTPSRSDTDPSSSHARSGPLRQLNPSPMQGYRIRLTIQDAPGPLVLTDATAQYDVVNEVQCGKQRPTGGLYRMVSNEVLPLRKVDDVTYEGVVYLDQILDGDYYGYGACKWELSEVRAGLSATGSTGETRFAPYFSSESVQSLDSETRYFWKARYPRSDVDDFTSFGETDRTRIKSELQNQLFTMTWSATRMEVSP